MPAPKVLTILRPGATRSGLAKPSSVRPRLLIGHRLSSVRVAVWFSSRHPTRITCGSLPGAYHTASGAAPRLPADVTTATPPFPTYPPAASIGRVAWLSREPAEAEIFRRPLC